MKNPDFELFIEIRNENAYLFTKKIRCAGGLPLRTQGKTLVFVDSLESLLAAWYLMRRGCSVVFLNADKSLFATLDIFIRKWHSDNDIVIFDDCKSIYKTINEVAVEKNCNALITGHSLYDSSCNAILSVSYTHLTLPTN